MNDFESRLLNFLSDKKLVIVDELGRGHSAKTFLVSDGKKNFVIKIESVKSRRINMVEKEIFFLKKANDVFVGPKLIDYDLVNRVVLMEFIDGLTLEEFLKVEKNSLSVEKALTNLVLKAKALDSINLNHRQLMGRCRNILVKKKLEVEIIDFEKAHEAVVPRNMNQLRSMFYNSKDSAIRKKVISIISEKKLKEILEIE